MGKSQVERVARAVSEGSAVDWQVLKETSDPTEWAVLRHLRAVAELTGSRLGEASRARTGVSIVASLICAVAGLQILAAAATFLGQLVQGLPFPVVLQGSATIALAVCAAMLIGLGRDSRAIHLAGFLLMLGSASSQRFLAPYRGDGPAALLTSGIYPDAFLPLFAWAFVREFPRVIRFSRQDNVSGGAVRLSGAVGLLLFVVNLLLVWTPDWAAWAGLAALERGGRSPYWGIVFALFVPSVAVMLSRIRHAEVSERRRVKLFLGGVVAGLMPLVIIVGLELAIPAFDQFTSRPAILFIVDSAIYASILSVPFVTTYSVLVDRVLPAVVIIRSTLRYALARQTLMAAIAVPVLALLYGLVANRHLTIAELGSQPEARLAAALAVGAMGLLLARGRLLRALNRRYFRDEIDVARALAGLTDGLSHARDRRQVAELLEAALQPALQVTHASLYLPLPVHYAPIRGHGRALPTESALLPIMEASPDPLDLQRPGLRDLLPRHDREWVERNGVGAMVPVTHGGLMLGFITVGHRLNDLPFSKDLATFLSTAAASAALALRGLSDGADAIAPGTERESPPAAECVVCNRVMTGDAAGCTCGGRLRTASVPEVLSGKFTVTHRLGAGGMGVVYRALDTTLGREVALKTLPRLTPAAADRLTREAQSMARVAGSTLATIHGVERWRGSPVLVIELLEGGTLAERLASGPLPIDEAVSITRQILDCLEHLHDRGLVHRDVKPANIGFTAGGNLKLLDFGLAAIEGPVTRETDMRVEGSGEDVSAVTSVAGTPLYLPPEAFEGAKPSPAFDLWAAAMVLYESIAGRHPWRDRLTRSSIRRVRVAELTTIRPDCPPWLSDVVTRALSVTPEQRPQTAKHFANELTAGRESA